MNQSKPERFLDFLNHKIHLLAMVGLFINTNERVPYPFIYLAPVPGKPISANRGLNIANRRINFIPLLDSVPEFTINLNLGVN